MRRTGGRTSIGWALAAALALGGCPAPPDDPPPAAPSPPPEPPVAEALAPLPESSPYSGEGAYQPVAVQPAIPPHELPAPGRLANLRAFPALTAAQTQALAGQGFFATPTGEPNLDALYRENAANGWPPFVTADSLLYGFDRVVAATRLRLEEDSFPALLSALTLTLLERSQAQMATVSGGELREAARHNVAYFTVAASLLGLSVEVDDQAGRMAAQQIEALGAGQRGPLWPYAVDLPAPPGEARAGRYRAALAWYALPLAPRFVDARGDEVFSARIARQILLMTHALAADPAAPLEQWYTLHDTRRFLLGEDALAGPAVALRAAAEVYGGERTLDDCADAAKLKAFVDELAAASPPPVPAPAGDPPRPGAVRVALLPEPLPLDEEVRRELLAAGGDAVGGLAVLAALGQPRATELLTERYRVGRTRPAYRQAIQRLQQEVASVPAEEWRRNLRRGRLWAAAGLTVAGSEGRPAFQRSAAWGDRTLLATLGLWAALRVSDGAGLAVVTEEETAAKPAPAAYVEPAPEAFARTGWMARRLAEGLVAHGLATEPMLAPLQSLSEWASFLERVAARELRNESLDAAQRERLAAYGDALAQWIDPAGVALDAELPAVAPLPPVFGEAPLVVGLGAAQALYVVIPHEGRFYLSRGATLSYHEFAGNAPSDEAWETAIETGAAPAQPEWARGVVIANPYWPQLPLAEAGPVAGE